MDNREVLNNLTQQLNEMNASEAQAPGTNPASPGVPTPQLTSGNTPIARRSRMQELQAQAQAGNQTGTPTVRTQGDAYTPVNVGSTPNPQPTPTVNGTPTQNGTTIINTTASSNSGGGLSGIFSNKPVMIIGVALLGLLAVLGMWSLGLFGEQTPPEDEQDPNQLDTELEWIDPSIPQFQYTFDEIEELRAAGYTGTEIEDAQLNQVPSADLIAQAKEQQQKWYEENILPMYDTTSEQFDEYVSDTWLSLEERTDADSWTQIAGYYVERKNLDYETIPVHGNQLFIKIFLDDSAHEDYFFLNVTPEEWVKLNEDGNVIVEYTYVTKLIPDPAFPDSFIEDTESTFIVSATLDIIE